VKECNKREKERDKIRDKIRAGKRMGKKRIPIGERIKRAEERTEEEEI
jgi:hypothetical protein